jgi:pyridoxal phosphate enzyme (YggS family)
MNSAERLKAVHESVELLARRYQRPLPKIVAVSKTHPVERIQEIYDLGQRAFGENYLAEGVDKIMRLPAEVEWHMLGPVQSNKTALVGAHFHWLHSLDRIKIAQRLNEQRAAQLPPLNVLLQLNISDEDSKGGLPWQDRDALAQLAEAVRVLPRLRLRGVMAMAGAHLTLADARTQFARARAAYEHLQADCASGGGGIDTLSMGMSADLEAAIAEGSTMLRVGTAIFGARH